MSALVGIVQLLLEDQNVMPPDLPDPWVVEIQAMVDKRVWAPELPEEEIKEMPRQCVVVTRSGGASTGPGARSYAPWLNNRLDVRCYGKTPYEAEVLQSAVYNFMTQLELKPDGNLGNQRVAGGSIIKNAVVSGGPIPGRDADGDWPFQLTIFDVASTPAT